MAFLKERKGSQIVEATMVLPVTILFTVAMIGLLMSFYLQLLEQIEVHGEERTEMYTQKEITVLRIKANIPSAYEQEAES